MKLLLVLSAVPYPVRAGGTQAVYNMVEGLRKYVKIGVALSFHKDKIADFKALKSIWPDVTFFENVQKRDMSHILRRIFQNKVSDYTLGDKRLRGLQVPISYYRAELLDFVRNSIDSFNPDIIQTEFYSNEDMVYLFPSHIKRVFVQHEIRYVVNKMWIEEYKFKQTNMLRAFYNKIKADEIAAMNQFDAVLTLNDVDRDILIKDGIKTNIYSSPVCVAPACIRNECAFSGKLVFVGIGGHPPNVEGLAWFVKEVWPSVVRDYPDLQLHVVGKWTEGQKALYKNDKNIFFDGFVDSLQEALKGAISIVPIIRGSGIRMKILDSVNFGSPFISTTIGALGMGFEDGRDCFIADTAKEFINKLKRMIEDKGLREFFYRNSYEVYKKLYTKEAVVKRRLMIYEQILCS